MATLSSIVHGATVLTATPVAEAVAEAAAEAVAAAARQLLSARQGLDAAREIKTMTDERTGDTWKQCGSYEERDVAATEVRKAEAGLLRTLLVVPAGDLLGTAVTRAVDASDGLYSPQWSLVDMATATTPAQRRTMVRLAMSYGHEWAGCVERVWVDHGIALWPSGDPRLPGGIGPCPNHVTGSGRTRWTVLADGSVEWEVWRGPRQTEEVIDGPPWRGFRTRVRQVVNHPPEPVLRGVTSPDGDDEVKWRSPLCEEHHEGATPYF